MNDHDTVFEREKEKAYESYKHLPSLQLEMLQKDLRRKAVGSMPSHWLIAQLEVLHELLKEPTK